MFEGQGHFHFAKCTSIGKSLSQLEAYEEFGISKIMRRKLFSHAKTYFHDIVLLISQKQQHLGN